METEIDSTRAIDVYANGIRFRVRTAGEGDKLALLLHGFPESWYAWRAQIPQLAKLGYRVWAPDMRGYGDSERPKGLRAYRIDTLLDDVAGLIDAADAKEVVLVGHDWGGAIAWLFALSERRKLDRLIILNMPFPEIFINHLRALGPQFRKSWYIFSFQLPLVPEWFLTRNEGADFLRIFPKRLDARAKNLFRDNARVPGALTAMLNYYRAALRFGLPRLPLRRVEIPTLMIWGDRDQAFINEVTDGTEEFVPNLTFRRLHGASHWVQQDAPEMVNTMLEAWLEGREVPESPR